MKDNKIQAATGVLLGFLLVVSLVIGGCAKPAPPTPAPGPTPEVKPITLQFAHPLSYEGMLGETIMWAANEVGKRTGGKIEFEMYWGGSLLSPEDQLEGLASGIADVGVPWASFTPAKTPLMAMGCLPMVSGTTRSTVLTQTELFTTYPYVQDTLRKYNMRYWFNVISSPTVLLMAKSPVRTAADLKGKKIWSYGEISTLIGELGGTGVFISEGEIIPALQTGTLDGTIKVFEDILAYGHHKVAPYITMVILCIDFDGFVGINLDVWNSLSPDIQKVFDEVVDEYNERRIERVDGVYERDMPQLKEDGAVFFELSPEETARWKEKAKVIWERWIEDLEAKDIPARDFFNTYVELQHKYGVDVLE